jgi:predicted DNA-binding transcriptional regulator AlpA
MTPWPQMMRRTTAAAYLDMSEAAFVREIAAGRLPSGVMIGGREHWRKDAIDRALDHVTGEANNSWRDKFRDKLRDQAA